MLRRFNLAAAMVLWKLREEAAKAGNSE
jgi:hypothetical protein